MSFPGLEIPIDGFVQTSMKKNSCAAIKYRPRILISTLWMQFWSFTVLRTALKVSLGLALSELVRRISAHYDRQITVQTRAVQYSTKKIKLGSLFHHFVFISSNCYSKYYWKTTVLKSRWTNMFNYIWRTRLVGQCLSAVLQYFIVVLLCHTFYLYHNITSSVIGKIAQGRIAVLIIFRLIVQP